MFGINLTGINSGQIPPQDDKTAKKHKRNSLSESALNSILTYKKPVETHDNNNPNPVRNDNKKVKYNKDGTISNFKYDDDGSVTYESVKDVKGRNVSNSYFLYNKEKGYRTEVKCIFNENGQVVKKVQINTTNGKEVYRKVSDWNPDNSALTVCDFDDKGALLEKWEGQSDGLPDNYNINDFGEGEITKTLFRMSNN